LRDNFTVVKFRLRTRVKYLNISVIQLSLPSDFRVRFRGRDKDYILGQECKQNMLIQEHVLTCLKSSPFAVSGPKNVLSYK